MFTLLHIRFLQLRRQLQGAGPAYSLLAVLVLGILELGIYTQYHTPGRAIYVTGAIVLTLVSIHLSRKDAQFVHRQISRPAGNMFLEYALLSLFLTIPCLFTVNWFHSLLVLPCCYGLAIWKITVRRRTALPHLSRIIPATDFEWLSGFRKTYVAIIPFAALALLTSPFRIIPLAFLWMLMAAVTSFYQECESISILRASGEPPKKFIRTKIIRHCRLLLILLLPALIINTCCQPGMLWINLIFLLLQLIVLVFCLLLKYTTYFPGVMLKGNVVLTGVATMSAAIPFLIPIPLLMSLRNYRRAIRNLQYYLHDQH